MSLAELIELGIEAETPEFFYFDGQDIAILTEEKLSF